MITIQNLEKHFGGQTLFVEASLQLDKGKRYGIVGANGSGKSTLLRILTGDEEASGGSVSFPRSARIGVLNQNHFEFDTVPIVQVVMMGNKMLWDAIEEKERILENAHESFDGDRYSVLEDIIVQHDGYALEARASEILEGLAIPTAVHHEPLSVLSGGFKLRVLLAQTLASSPDVLLLDEPTNHLDIVSIGWLENFLMNYAGCAVVVSHDHLFLDRVCTHIVDVDYQQITLYPGNFTAFEKAKAEERERRQAEIEKREAEIADHRAFIDRFKAKATKARQAQSRVKRMEKINIETLPQSSRQHPRFKFIQRRPSGRSVLELEDIFKAYGDKVVLDGVSMKVARGERVAVIGPNGIGKSTLLKTAVGTVEADLGEIEWGHEAHVGYFAQDHHDIIGEGTDTIESWLWGFCAEKPVGFVRGNLADVLFTKDDVAKKTAHLSGGEAARLIFAKLSIDQPNVLVLDEPTNHLDLEGIDALARALIKYDGTVIFVSHDRWFVSRVATRIVSIEPEGVEDYHGTYEEFLAKKGADHLDAESVREAHKEQKRAAKKAAKAEKAKAREGDSGGKAKGKKGKKNKNNR